MELNCDVGLFKQLCETVASRKPPQLLSILSVWSLSHLPHAESIRSHQIRPDRIRSDQVVEFQALMGEQTNKQKEFDNCPGVLETLKIMTYVMEYCRHNQRRYMVINHATRANKPYKLDLQNLIESQKQCSREGCINDGISFPFFPFFSIFSPFPIRTGQQQRRRIALTDNVIRFDDSIFRDHSMLAMRGGLVVR